MENVTDKLLSEAVTAIGEVAKIAKRAGKAKPGKLTPLQTEMLQRLDGARLGFVSKALLYDTPFRNLTSREHQAVFTLLKGGLLHVFEVRGALRDVESVPAARSGSNADRHYLIRKAV